MNCEANNKVNGVDETAFRAALEKRREQLQGSKSRLESEIGGLQLQLGELDDQIAHIEALLKPVVNPNSSAFPSDKNDDVNPLADAVVELIRTNKGPMHYRRIHEELSKTDIELPMGKDPATTLLARYYKDNRLYRPKRGTYDLRNGRSVKSVGTKRRRNRRNK